MVGDDATVQEFLGVIEEESVRVTRLINDLLNLSRIESGRIRFKQGPVALHALLTRAIRTAQPKALAGDIRNEADIPPDLPPFRGDGDAMQQMLTNLVDNAVKYNRAGGRVEVRAVLNGGVAVEISDTSIGMPERAVRRHELVDAEWADQERLRAHDPLLRLVGHHAAHDDRNGGRGGLGGQAVSQFVAVHHRHPDVEQDEVDGRGTRDVQRLQAILSLDDVVPRLDEVMLHDPADSPIVFDQQHALDAPPPVRGRTKRTMLPAPSTLSTSRCVPWAARPEGEGTGLGRIIQGIVETHGGRIGVTSTLGEGTTFTLQFPALPGGGA